MTMTGRERIDLTMRHREPDRVPVMCQLSIGHYNLNGGYKPHEIWYDTDAFVDATVKLARRYAFDGILVVLPGRPPDYLNQVHSIREDDDGQWLHWKNGDRTFCPWDDMPHFHPADGFGLKRATFETFDPDRDLANADDFTGHHWNTLFHIQDIPGKPDRGLLREGGIPDYLFHALDRVMARAADLSVHGSVYSPLTHYYELFGYERALQGFLDDPGRVHAILDRLTDSVIAWAQALLTRGAQALDLSSAFVAGPFLSRRMYRDFVVPYERRVCQTVRDAGGIIYTHTCGSIGDRLDLMADTATHGVDTLDPPPLGNCDLAAAKHALGDRLFFKGNMNSVAMLNYTTEREVIDEATRPLLAGMPGAGYILSTACSVAPRVEPWKLELLVPLAEKLGRY